MKVLTLTQPWASLMAFGEKHIETRSWGTSYKGPLLIHAAKGFPKDCKALCATEPFKSVLLRHGVHQAADLPTGVILARVELVNAVGTGWLLGNFTGELALSPGEHTWKTYAAEHEEAFGDYTDGRWGWLTRHPQRLVPRAAKGALGLWTYDGPPLLEWLAVQEETRS